MDMNKVNQSDGGLNISVDSSKLKAYICITPFSKSDDDGIKNNLAVSQKYTLESVEEALKARGIVNGLMYENFKEAIEGNKEVLIAKGTPSTDPVDDRIEYYFPIDQVRKQITEDGKIDYMDAGSIFFVKEGTPLARLIVGKDGNPGKDVFGKVIPAPRRKRERLKRGPNCDFTQDNQVVVAKISGMPCLKNGTITVFNTYSLNSDVDNKTGNVVFDGNIYIHGNVKEGMKVISRGGITITSNVDSSELKADGDVTVMKNLICSEIKAGAGEVPQQIAVNYLKNITDFFTNFTEAFSEFVSNAELIKDKSKDAIIKALLQLKFSDIKQKVGTAVAYFKATKVDNNISSLFNDSLKLYTFLESGFLSNLELLSKQAIKNSDYIDSYESVYSASSVMVGSSQNSTIYATNDVEICGKGCYNTTINTKNNVRFTGYPGIFRGGSITAGGSVSARELGSTAEVYTVIRTTKDGVVTADRIYPNVIIYFDTMVYKVENAYKNFKACIKDRELILEKQML